ncbi:MAG: flagellar basal body-associated protein FliL [Treponematales bacterium]
MALRFVALGLLGVLLGGSVYGLFFKRGEQPAPGGEIAQDGAKENFTGIGRLRVSTRPPGASTVIVSISFPYQPGDRAFAEELAFKVRDLREAAADFFASLPPEELRGVDETAVKAGLLERFNAVLHLGRIERLDFSDFMILD